MRTKLALCLVLLPLAACASEETQRTAFRDASIASCMAASRNAPTPPGMAGFDWNSLCTCATDKIMEGKSASELAALEADGPGQQAAVQQCVMQMLPGMQGAPAAPAAPTG